jgi:TPP-dependent pyruvate/acetoin dehydrogenase alpha subunit
MLINNNPQAQSTIQRIKRADMDPANAAASALYSGAAQNAQGVAGVSTTQAAADAKADNIDAAFAKTRVQLQATTATPSATDVPKTDATSSARSDFTDYMKKSPAERIREQLLKEQGLTEEEVKNLPQEKQDAISKEVAARLKDQQAQQVAAKTADPQAQTVKETLAAI